MMVNAILLVGVSLFTEIGDLDDFSKKIVLFSGGGAADYRDIFGPEYIYDSLMNHLLLTMKITNQYIFQKMKAIIGGLYIGPYETESECLPKKH